MNSPTNTTSAVLLKCYCFCFWLLLLMQHQQELKQHGSLTFCDAFLSRSNDYHRRKTSRSTVMNYVANDGDADDGRDLSSLSTSSSWFQNTIQTTTNQNDIEMTLKDLFQGFESTCTTASKKLGFLFVSNDWPLQKITSIAMNLLGGDEGIDLITIVGGGVIGQGQELEGNGSMSFLCGPASSSSSSSSSDYDADDKAVIFSCSNKDIFLPKLSKQSSVLLFSDPYCHQIQALFGKLQDLDCITAGGITVPTSEKEPSLAWNDKVFETGSLLGVTLPKTIGLQCIVSQGGCRPVGPTYRVTRVDGPALHELDKERAIDQLDATIKQCTEQDQELVRNMGVLGGIYYNNNNHKTNNKKEETTRMMMKKDDDGGKVVLNNCDMDEFMVRQVTGFRPRSGSILVCGQPQIQPGDFFRFHVRDVDLALDDWQLILERTQTERLFLEKTDTPILAALQISSLARGQDFFSKPNVDLQFTKQLLSSTSTTSPLTTNSTTTTTTSSFSPPIGGFFANAEIGPVGIRMGAQADQIQTHLHGFATVVAILCDYSNMETTTSSSSRRRSEENINSNNDIQTIIDCQDIIETSSSSSNNSTSTLTVWE